MPNLFINRVNIVDEKSWRAYYGFENKYMSRISLLKDIKGTFSILIIFCKSPAGLLNILGEQKMPAGFRLGSLKLVDINAVANEF